MADGGSIKARVLRSGIWVGISEVGLQILSLVRSIALARLLTPEIFGLMGLAMIVVRAIETFTRPGIAQALIARQKAFDEASTTAFTLLIARGVLLAGALAAAAPWVARFYEAAELERILQVLSAVFLIGSLNNINIIARQKELDFRRLTYLSQTTTLIGTVVTIAAAYWLRSVWALVIGQLVSLSLHAVLSYALIPGRMRLGVNREVARDLFAYGKFITGSSVVLFTATELDSAVIGKVLGTEQLGFYTLAFTIAHLATANLSKIASSVMMPAYSKLQSDIAALRRAFIRTLSLVLFIVLPASVGLIVIAEPLMIVVYGDKWLPAALPLQLLAVFGLFRAVAAFNGYLFEGIGLPKVAFNLGILRLAIIAPVIVPMAQHFGLAGAALTVTAGIAAQWFAGLIYLKKSVAVSLRDILRLLFRPLWTAGAMSVVAWTSMQLLDGRTVLGLTATIISAAATYGLLNLSFLLQLKREGFR